MKNNFLKIAKVKDEASFYKKYPSEAAFFKAHPEAKKLIKKAQTGTIIPKTGGWWESNIDEPIQPVLGATTAAAPNNGLPYQSTGLPKQFTGEDYDQPGYKVGGKGNNIMGALPGAISSIGTGIGKIKDAKKQLKSLDQQAQVTGVQAKAATSRDIDAPNVMARNIKKQRDAMFQPTDPNTLFPTYGVGTNVLAKNGTEIQNTFAPNTMYTDAAYEPLDDSNIKQYNFGGPIPIAQNGFSNFMTGGGGDAISGMLGDVTGNTGEGDIGSGIGSLAGTALGGPLGGMVGGLVGKGIGSLFGQKRANQMKQFGNQIQTNQATMQGAGVANDVQSQYNGFLKNGGNLTNPQLITKFGEYDVKDLFYPDPTMDTLRVGGNLRSFTPPSEHGLQEYAMGGDLQTHWGGKMEPMSYNPFMGGDGITYMAKGNSHDTSDGHGRTGIGITYGDNPVEVEGGEPIFEEGGELPQEGFSFSPEDNDKKATVAGNLVMSKFVAEDLQDPKAEGKKYKHYIKDLSFQENKANKKQQKGLDILNKDNPSLLDNSTAQAIMLGTKMSLKQIAGKKKLAMIHQNAINDTAEEYGILADGLDKGKYIIDKKAMKEQAKYGKELFKAQNGKWTPLNPNGYKALEKFERTKGTSKGTSMGDNYDVHQQDKEITEAIKNSIGIDVWDKLPEDVKTQAFSFAFNNGYEKKNWLTGLAQAINPKIDRLNTSKEDAIKIIKNSPIPNNISETYENVLNDQYNSLGKSRPEAYKNSWQYRPAEIKKYFNEYSGNTNFSQDPQQLSYDAQGSLTAIPQAPAQQNNTQASGFQGPGSGVLRPYIDPQTAQNDPQTPIDYSFGVPGANATSFSQDVPSNHYSDLTPDEVKELNDLYTKASAFKGKGSNPIVKQFQRRFHELLPNLALNISQNDPHGVTTAGRKKGLTKEDLFQGSNTADVLAKNNEEGIFGDRTEQYKAALDKLKTPPPGEMMKGFKPKEQPTSSSTDKSNTSVGAIPAKKRNTFLDIASQIAPYLTPSFKNPLDANQLYGENYALGRNKVEPVQANLYNPLLETPYDISLQDQLNANQGDFNAIQRMTGNNPAALSALAGQKYGANSKVLADQFRMNQAEKAGVYGRNRQSLNDAQLKNLGIMDQQYVRQNQAKSNAEALTQSALNSMSDKIQKNKLETMGYNVYANKFPGYTFTSEGRLIKNPSFQQFEIPTVGSTASGRGKQTAPEGFEYLYDDEGNVKKMQNKAKEKTARNGSLVKAFKNI